MKTEADFRRHVTCLLVQMGAHVSNIESHQTSAGIPDVNYFLSFIDVWLELKVVASSGQVKMRPPQKKWHTDRHEAGGQSWVMVLDPLSGRVGLLPGYIAAELPLALSAWEKNSIAFHVSQLEHMLHEITEYVNGQQHASYRNRATQNPRSTGPALPEGGQDVGGHHWLHDKP